MHPGRIANFNRIYEEPDNWNKAAHGSCWPLYGRMDRHAGESFIKTAWFPTTIEIQAMLHGAPVYASIWGENMPAMKVEAGAPTESINRLPRAVRADRSMLANRCITVQFERAPTDEEIAIIAQHLG